jgi:hypothetical protein
MKSVSLKAILHLFSESLQAKLQERLPSVQAISATQKPDGSYSAAVWPAVPDAWPDGTTAYWVKEKGPSRTMQAVALVESGATLSEAARAAGVNVAAVHRAIARRRDKPICPCCNQVIRDHRSS